MINLARFVLALALVVLCARVASADDRARARTAFRAGSQHYNLGEFQQALDSFKEAYRRVEDPSFLFNIAQCERQLGHKREAVREYRAYLNNADNAGNREAVKETIAQLQKELDADDERARDAARPAIAPPPAIVTPPAETAATPVLVATPTPQIEHKPAYKKWWVWTIVGGVVAAGAATGLALALTRSGPAPHVDTSLGTASPW